MAAAIIKTSPLILMAEDSLKAFLAKVQSDPDLQQRIKAVASEGDFENIASIADEAGITLSAEDVLQLKPPSEQELEEGIVRAYTTYPWSTCSTNIGCK